MKFIISLLTIVLISMLILTSKVRADQPIMNMMPRWSNGYGIQFIQEYSYNRDLLIGDKSIGNNLSEEVYILNIEGVYTFERWIRITAKIPYIIHAKREILNKNDKIIKQTDQGIGDLTLAAPLKKYFNLDSRSGSWTFSPQLRIPLKNSDDSYNIADRLWGTGFSIGYETETVNWFISLGAHLWIFEAPEPFQAGLNLNLGKNFFALGSSGQILWETFFHWEDDGSYLLKSGPAFYWKFNDTIHFRSEWKHSFIDYKGIIDHGNGSTLKVGIGFVF